MTVRSIIAAIVLAALTGCATVQAANYSGSSKRSSSAITAFKKSNPCPSTGKRSGSCPGYEIDHRQPLAAGGSDHPSNMQWLTKSDHKEKTRRERKNCVYKCKR